MQEFLKQFQTWIKNRLEAIPLIKLSSNEIEITKQKIEETKKSGKEIKSAIKEQEIIVKKVIKEWNRLSKNTIKQSSLIMNSVSDTFNGIQVWNPEDHIEEEIIINGEVDGEEETNN